MTIHNIKGTYLKLITCKIEKIYLIAAGVILFSGLFLPNFINAQSNSLAQFERAKSSFRKGIYHFNKMQYLASAEFFRKAITTYPDYYTAREYLARSYVLAGFRDEALTEWEIIAQMTSNNIAVQNKIDTIRYRNTGSKRNKTVDEEYIFTEKYNSSNLESFRFHSPVDIAIDRERNIYITSFSPGKIVKLDSNGKGVKTYNPFVGTKLFGIDVRDNTVVVADFKNDQIYLMDSNLTNMKSFGKTGNGAGQFHGPEGVCFDPTGNIYVVDSGNHRVQKFDPNWKFVLSMGESGEYDGQLNKPTDVAVCNNRVYITDTGNKRVSCFDDSGNFIEHVPADDIQAPRGINCFDNRLMIADEMKGLLLYDQIDRKYKWQNLTEHGNKVIGKLFSSTFDSNGFLYCLDNKSEQVTVFSPISTRYTNIDIEIIKVDTNKFPVVALYINVRSRDGNPIYGLKNTNFSVVEDNSTISRLYVDYLKDLRPNTSMVLCVDRSSETKKYHTEMPWVAEFILKKMKKDDSIQVQNFNTDNWIGNKFDWSRRRTLKALKKRKYKKGKNIGRALYNSINELIPRINRRAVILLTDGKVEDTSFERYSAETIIAYARNHYVPIYIISFKDKNPALVKIATETGGALYRASEIDNLRTLYQNIKYQEEYRYVVVYYSFKSSEFKGWWSDLKIDINHKKNNGNEWGGYFVPQ